MSGLGLLSDYNNDSELSEPDDKTESSRESKTQVIKLIIPHLLFLIKPILAEFRIKVFKFVQLLLTSTFQCFLGKWPLGSIKFTPILFLCLEPIKVGDIIQTINRSRGKPLLSPSLR